MTISSLSIIAALIIVSLVAVAIYLHIKLYQQGRKHHEAALEAEKRIEQRHQKYRNDIIFISKAYLAEQVELPEASLRIHKLAEQIPLEDEVRSAVSIFSSIAVQIEHFPTHKNWKDLDKKTRRNYRQELARLTKEHHEKARDAAELIVKFSQQTIH